MVARRRVPAAAVSLVATASMASACKGGDGAASDGEVLVYSMASISGQVNAMAELTPRMTRVITIPNHTLAMVFKASQFALSAPRRSTSQRHQYSGASEERDVPERLGGFAELAAVG